jgi:hypothetical protein
MSIRLKCIKQGLRGEGFQAVSKCCGSTFTFSSLTLSLFTTLSLLTVAIPCVVHTVTDFTCGYQSLFVYLSNK